jgi:exonuclease SbcD
VSAADVPARPTTAVRVLHTSDWHLGVTVRTHSRAADHDEVLAELVAVAAAAQPDLIVHTGDLFDGHRPAMHEFGRAIRALRALADVAPVVVLAGNHDSAVAMEVLGIALGDEHPDDVVAGTYDPATPSRHRIRVHARPSNAARGAVATYPTRAGGRLRLVALPFVHANRVLGDFDDLLEANATYNDSLRKIIGVLSKAAFEDFDPTADVAVFASHLHVKDARTSSEKTIHISSDYATDPAHLEARFGYLAFGHIHVPQAVAGGRGQYAGSVLEVDFGERGEAKRVVVVDLAPGRPSVVTSVPLTGGRRLHVVRAALSELHRHASSVGRGLVEVTVAAEPPGASATAPPRLDEPIVLAGTTFDTLSAAVAHVLPDATVVGVLDGRNPAVATADELVVPDVPATLNESFRAWLADADAVLAQGEGLADPARVASLFDELHAAATGGGDPVLGEVLVLDGLPVGGPGTAAPMRQEA